MTVHEASAVQQYFNILSIDGGGIRGIIPAKAIAKMEDFSYNYYMKMGYSNWEPYYTLEDKNGVLKGTLITKMPMKDMFDMFAGTSTGSILASALTIPKKKGERDPRFWAEDAVKIYEDGGPTIFK
jgi:patatin-like phospholipase/acyl hydrolase